MDFSLIVNNLIAAPILFFFLGMLATLVRSDLEIPQPVARFLSIYLLLAIGLHGGVELAHSGLTGHVLATLGTAVASAALVPVACFFVLRLKLDTANAAAIAATFGSISAVTFITACNFLTDQKVPFSGHMVAAMALMESPAIIVGVLLARMFASGDDPEAGKAFDWKHLLREALLNGAVFLLLGSLVIGYFTAHKDWESLRPLVDQPFKGVLCLFLLDMGLVAARRLKPLRQSGAFLIGFAIISPFCQALLGIGLSKMLGLSPGDALLMAILCGSASYIAVPAAVRLAIPKANPSFYVPLALAVTFPFNIAVGIPLYFSLIQKVW